MSSESAHGVWEPLLLKTDPPQLTWRIALTTVYALMCYTVITVEYQEEIVARGLGTGGSGGSMNRGPRAPGARVHTYIHKEYLYRAYYPNSKSLYALWSLNKKSLQLSSESCE